MLTRIDCRRLWLSDKKHECSQQNQDLKGDEEEWHVSFFLRHRIAEVSRCKRGLET
jgi:hypothetical protein